MKKLFYLTLLATSVLCVGCNVDESYDLSNLDDSNIGIGTDESYFDIPLAEVTLDAKTLMSESSSSARSSRADDIYDYLNVEEVLNMVNDLLVFLPTVLTGDYSGGIELDMLQVEEYAAGLVDIFFDEIASDSAKRLAFCEFVLAESGDSDSAYSDIIEDLNLVTGEYASAQEYSDELSSLLNSSDSAVQANIESLKSTIVDVIVENTAGFKTEYEMEESFGGIDINDDTISLLDGNLDGDSNVIYLYFTLITDLPLDIVITVQIKIPGDDATSDRWVSLSDYASADEDSDDKIETADELRAILSSLEISATISINNYDPSNGEINLEDQSIIIKLIARKMGGLSVSL